MKNYDVEMPCGTKFIDIDMPYSVQSYDITLKKSTHSLNMTVNELRNITYLHTADDNELTVDINPSTNARMSFGVGLHPLDDIGLVTDTSVSKIVKTLYMKINEAMEAGANPAVIASIVNMAVMDISGLEISISPIDIIFGRLVFLSEIDHHILSALDSRLMGDVDYIIDKL